MWNKDQHPEDKEIPGASSLAAGYFFLLGADKTRSVSVRPQRGMQSIPSLGVLIFKGADKTRSVYMSLTADGAGTRESSFLPRTGPCQRGVETGLNVPQQGTGSARSESLRVAERGRGAGIKLPAPHGAVSAGRRNGAQRAAAGDRLRKKRKLAQPRKEQKTSQS